MTDADRPTAADLVAEALAAAGCRRAFGIPGGEVLAIMDALERAGVAFHLVKHENAGGFMAEAAHHAAARAGAPAPGVLVATIGPGLANAMNAVLNALQDQVPLVVISGCVDLAEAETYTHQVLDQTALMRPIVKGSFRLAEGAVDVQVAKAIELAMASPQGPVHLDLAVSLATRPQPAPRRFRTPAAAPAAPADGPDLERARAMIAAATRPVILAGVGAVKDDAGPALRAAAERFDAPVLTTYKAKGLLDETHPLSLGGHGLSPVSDGIVLPLLEAADLVLSVGYDPIEMRAGWIDPFAPEKHVEIAHAPNRHGMHGAAASFVGDVRAGLARLTDNLAPAGETWPERDWREIKAALDARFCDRDAWGPHQAFAAARRASPPETVVTVDSGAHRILLSQMWPAPAPRTVLQSSAFCTMGAALPLAIGMKISEPETPVLAVMGDAGLEMVMGELATLRDLHAPVAVMVMVDESLALIEMKQRRSGLDNLGVDFPGTEFVALAAAMGGVGRWIQDAASLEAELADAYRRETFSILACAIERKAYDGAF